VIQLYAEEKSVEVPSMQGNMFSTNNLWAEIVKAKVKDFTGRFVIEHRAWPDPIWAVLMVLPQAAQAFNEARPTPPVAD